MANRTLLPVCLVGLVAVSLVGVVIYQDFSGSQQRKKADEVARTTPLPSSPISVPADAQQWSLPADIGTMILVQHTNERAVAAMAGDFWRVKMNDPLRIVATTNMLQPDPGSRFFILEPYNGVVEIDGPVNWKPEQEQSFMDMAAYVSAQLKTRAVAALVGPGAQSGAFGVFENGAQRFRLRRSLSMRDGGLQAIVHVDGMEWARETASFEPASGNDNDVTLRDANQLTHALGLRLTGAPMPEQCLLLIE